jgi:hypothetical protein
MNPGNSPWLTLHDDAPGQLGSVIEGSPLIAFGDAVSALANATGPTAAIAHEIPAMAVKRFSEDNMSCLLLSRGRGYRRRLRGGRKIVTRTPPLWRLKRTGRISSVNDDAEPSSLRLTLGTVLP